MEDKLFAIINNLLLANNKIEKPIIIKPSHKLQDDLGLDSFNLAELTVYIEEEFGVDIFEDGIVKTISEILTKLKKQNEFIFYLRHTSEK